MVRAVVARPIERVDGSLVGSLADVPVPGRGRLDGDALAESRAIGEGAQHDLGHRRAADVAGADEGNSEGLRGVPSGFRSRHGPILDEIGAGHSRQITPALRWAVRVEGGSR